jgi:hypothetical protein
MTVWAQIDAMKAKFDNDMRSARAAAESYKFTIPKALPHGAWAARSMKSAKHSTVLNAPSADELIAAMKAAFDAAELKAKAAQRV